MFKNFKKLGIVLFFLIAVFGFTMSSFNAWTPPKDYVDVIDLDDFNNTRVYDLKVGDSILITYFKDKITGYGRGAVLGVYDEYFTGSPHSVIITAYSVSKFPIYAVIRTESDEIEHKLHFNIYN